jgi:RNA polymerase sigma-70 factor (ECF subfamily)
MGALPASESASSFEDELARLHPDAFGWARCCGGGGRSEAEEVLQTAYLRALSGAARFAGRSSLETWLYGVVRRVASERRRRSALGRLVLLRWAARGETAGPGPAEAVERASEAERLRRALARLSRRQRELLHLVLYQELTIAEAGAVLGIGAGSARTHYSRGKARLRELLAGGDPR